MPALPSPLVTLMSIPSPSEGVWHIGPVPIRAYALCIILGIVFAIWLGERRWVARGGRAGEVSDLAIWAVPFGLVGGRLYHVITDWELYFGEGQNPITALYVWRGGLGIWGAIALGIVGVWIGARLRGLKLLPLLDALAPGVLVAQALGRWGNWFNQELYGRPTDLPWGLEIDPGLGDGVRSQFGPDVLFHPTFLYECLWNLAAFALLIWLDRRYRLGFGRVAALYVMLYTAGPRLDRVPPHRQRPDGRRARACGSTCGPRSCCSSRRRRSSPGPPAATRGARRSSGPGSRTPTDADDSADQPASGPTA